jgi:hypothetical protein
MSFVHCTVVGHFGNGSFQGSQGVSPLRPLPLEDVESVLAEYSHAIRDHVVYQDGYVVACWTNDPSLSDEIMRFAYDLAERQHCQAKENPAAVFPIPGR